MASEKTVTYEIRTLIGGRWEISVRREGANEAKMVAEAKHLLDLPHVAGVKVIKEVYDETDRSYVDVPVYTQHQPGREAEAKAAPEPVRRPRAGAMAVGRGAEVSSRPRRQAEPSKRDTGDRLFDLFRAPPDRRHAGMAFGLALVLAIALSAALFFAEGGASQGTAGTIRFLGYLALLSALFTAPLIWFFYLRGAPRPEPKPDSPEPPSKPATESAAKPAPPELDEPEQPAPEPDTADTLPDTAAVEPEQEPLDAVEAEAAPEPEPDPDALSEWDETVLNSGADEILKFMRESMSYATRNSPHAKDGGLFGRNLFGCFLFLAGATDAYAKQKRMAEKLHRPLLARVSRSFSGSAERAERFADTMDEYMRTERHQDIHKAGAEGMVARLTGDKESTGRHLVWALDAWNQRAEAAPEQVALMFTDIVGSTQFTQEHGDEESHRLVSAHNAIVRESLRFHGGAEVKHTGDGIMASFATPTQAVPCAVAVLRGVRLHNRNHPAREMHLRIGIGVGEPIEEGGDFFGSTVQLAARLCALAESDQVYVAAELKDLHAEDSVPFTDLGDHSLKGFKEPVRVFEVKWRDVGGDTTAEPAAEEGAAPAGEAGRSDPGSN